MVAGVIIPNIGRIFEPYILIWLGGLLFFNLIQLNVSDLASVFTRPQKVVLLAVIKLVILPLITYAITYLIYPKFSLPVLLLSGVSTGLGSPFVVNLAAGKLSLVVGMVIITSFAVPFILPTLVYLFFAKEFSIPILEMIILLSTALFIPLMAGWFTKTYVPRIAKIATERSPISSVIFVVLINFGMFAKFSHYFFVDPLFVIETTLIAFILFGFYGLVGYFASTINNRRKNKQLKISGFIAMAYVNNILIAIFAGEFFGSDVAALAALYNIPYYVGILVLKKITVYNSRK